MPRPKDLRVRDLAEMFSNCYFWEQDEHRRYTWVTGSILEKTHTDSEFFLGKSLAELGAVPVSDDGRWDRHWAVLDSRQPFVDLLFTFPAPTGEQRYISASGQPVFGSKGKFKGYRGISRDITARIRSERRRSLEQKVGRVLAESNDVAIAAPRIIRTICETLGWVCGARWELDAQRQMLRCAETWEGDGTADTSQFLTATRKLSPLAINTDGLIQRVCTQGEPLWANGITEDRSFLRAAEALKAGLRCAFAFPIRVGKQVVGVMEFYGREIIQPDSELLGGLIDVGSGIGVFYQRKQAEEELLRFRSAMDMSGDAIYLVDRDTMCFVDVNETASNRMGYTRVELLKMGPHDLLLVDRKELERAYDEVIAAGASGITTETHARSKDGRRSVAELHRRALRSGNKWIIVSIARDITQRKRAEQAALRLGRMFAALSATNEAIMRVKSVDELYQRVCDASVDGGKFLATAVLRADLGSRRIKAVAVAGKADSIRSAPALSLESTPPEQQGLVGKTFQSHAPSVSNDVLKDEGLQPWHAMAKQYGIAAAAVVPLVKGQEILGVLLFYSDERRAFDEEIVKLLERLAENVVFALENFEHETERKRAEERIQYLATHDGLTGLPNRVMFSELLNLAIPWAKRHEQKFAVLFIDLDRFKVINDTLGHEAGDVLLKEISTRFKQTLRASDVVARLGGDEFVVLVQEVAEASQVTTVARKILSAAIKPIMIQGQECRVTASVGISIYPTDAVDEQSLMKHADMAMYLAKEEGKNNFQFYSTDIKSQSLERLALEVNLRHAIERNELSLHYQAKLDLKSGQISGVEALLRWNSAELGSVSPIQLIPIAEETGLIVPIGRWVLRTACEQNVAWQRAGLPPVCVAVNLSPRQFADPDLLKDIAEALTETGMTPALLELEITESMVMHNIERAVKLLTAIKQLGVRLAIDDFGTGYSSLAQLKRFPIDTLKVDRSFIREIPNDSEDRAITEAIIAMGKSLSLNVVAEGVETVQQQAFLREQACDEMQGYYFSKPVASEQFAELLRQHIPVPQP